MVIYKEVDAHILIFNCKTCLRSRSKTLEIMHQVRKPVAVGRPPSRLVHLAFHAPGPQPRSVAADGFGLARRLDLAQVKLRWLRSAVSA